MEDIEDTRSHELRINIDAMLGMFTDLLSFLVLDTIWLSPDLNFATFRPSWTFSLISHKFIS